MTVRALHESIALVLARSISRAGVITGREPTSARRSVTSRERSEQAATGRELHPHDPKGGDVAKATVVIVLKGSPARCRMDSYSPSSLSRAGAYVVWSSRRCTGARDEREGRAQHPRESTAPMV